MRYNPRSNPLPPKGAVTTREIDLATAISEIKQACEAPEDGKSPFFIIAGAGISASIIPLASEIARKCKEIPLQTARELEAKLTSDAQREAVIESLMTAVRGLDDHAEAQIRAYDLVLRLVGGDAGASPRFRAYTAKALVNKGVALAELNRGEEAIQTYEECCAASPPITSHRCENI
jgi:hypothetical protein